MRIEDIKCFLNAVVKWQLCLIDPGNFPGHIFSNMYPSLFAAHA